MTIENDIDALVSDVTTRKAAVVKAKGNLDAIVAEGASAAGEAEGAALAALSARDEASAMATASEALATASVGATAYADLAAVATAKVEDAVDMFIYDTSLDSDGGAWRYRTQGTSWYREALDTATRGSRREFPAMAVIVAENNKVTIYDGDDPALPMWMVFGSQGYINAATAYPVTSTSAKNSKIVLAQGGGYGGGAVVDLLADGATRYRSRSSTNGSQGASVIPVSGRNEGQNPYDDGQSQGTIVNETVNDVAMTVLPNAPIDPATGLPVPTIAVATDGGVSVIKDDGAVVDLTKLVSGSVNASRVVFLEDGGIAWSSRDVNRYIQVLNAIPDADYAGDPDRLYSEGDQPAPGTNLTLLNLYAANHLVDGACAGGDGVTFLAERPDVPEQGMVAYTTKDYATGWMPGAIKGAWLADTDEGDLAEDELVTNGTFDVDASGWRAPNGATLAIEGGRLKVTSNGGGWEYALQTCSVVAGRAYRVSVIGEAGNVNPFLYLGSSTGAYDYAYQVLPNEVESTLHIVAKTNLLSIRLNPYATTSGDFALFDNVSVVPADADRSVNANGLVVHGRVRRAPVADGAELVAYSGFSPDNYLEGTGAVYVDTLYALGWEQTNGVWEFKHGVVSTAPIDGLTITGNTIRVAETKPKALIRLTETAPSADQLAKIEYDERALFEHGAACTLYGDSDAVTALAHDKVTNLLQVGTSAGRSVFDGLRRVAHTTQPVGNAIAAHNGLIIEG
jgi:hypothetical protein